MDNFYEEEPTEEQPKQSFMDKLFSKFSKKKEEPQSEYGSLEDTYGSSDSQSSDSFYGTSNQSDIQNEEYGEKKTSKLKLKIIDWIIIIVEVGLIIYTVLVFMGIAPWI